MNPSRRAVLKGALLVPGAAGAPAPRTARARASAGAAASPWDQVPAILARIVPPAFPDRTFPVTDYGAKPDNTTDCTPAFRAAIAACAAAGGGTVLVPGTGRFRTGQIHLLSDVRLHVEAGGTIRFRSDAGSYLPNVYTRWQGIECYNYSPFIYARGQTNLALTGAGTIDGNAAAGPWSGFDDRRGPDWDLLQQMAVDGVPVEQRRFGDGHHLKPSMIQFYGCTNILVEDLDLRNPAMWTIHPVLSRNITVRRVKIYSRGAMVDGGVRNVFAENNQIHAGSSYHGFYALYLKTNNRRGGVVDGVHVRNLTGGPCDRGGLFIDMNYSLTGPGHGPIVNPSIQNLTVDGLNIAGSPFAVKLTGSPAGHIKNVTISNSTFTQIDAPAPQIANADNVVLRNVRINGVLYGESP